MNLLILLITFIISSYNSNKLPNKNKGKTIHDNIGKCINPNGDYVSWYVIYTLQNSANKYAYHDPTMKTFKLYSTEEQSFPPLNIVKGLNKMTNNYLVWNDDSIAEHESQDIRFSSIGHSKGIFISAKKESTLLIHSLPKFPMLLLNNTFSEKFTGNWGVYVQTWFCLSLDEENSIKVLDGISHLPPPIQNFNVNNEKNSNITVLMQSMSEKIKRKRENKIISINVKNSPFEFTYFVRTNDETINLQYENDIPLYYESSLFVGTWSKPKLFDPSCDESENRLNILSILEFNILGVKYSSSQDHSKWAVTEKDIAFCIGDLNRTSSQLKRSGGVMCIKNKLLSKLVKQFIVTSQDCEVE